MGKKLLEHLRKRITKKNQKGFRTEKVREKVINYMLNGKDTIIRSIAE